jgi:methylmalonyl-CoA/ethylmalonyl-CoA epimerase
MVDQTLGTTTITQVGLIVRDIEARARAWADVLGVPVPQIIVTDPVDVAQTEYQGAPSTARAKLAFFHLGQISLELIEPIGAPSTWNDQLEQHGDSLHHIAFQIKGMQDKLAYLDAKGVPLVQRGEYTGGRYAYVDGSERLGAILELLEND